LKQEDTCVCVCVNRAKAVFFNLFAAAEPYTSVKVSHGTPWTDPWVQRRMRGWSYR